ncbi:MAG: MFS transporter [Myxococcota bacterium]
MYQYQGRTWLVACLVSTLYLAEGWPYVLVNSVSVLLLKDLGVSNPMIAVLTSCFYLPWMLKMFWASFVDVWWEQRVWIIWTQIVMGGLLCTCGLCLVLIGKGSLVFVLTLLFLGLAFCSATHDIAVDGYYIRALSEGEQAHFLGWRVFWYRVAMVCGSGGVLLSVGVVQEQWGWDFRWSWMLACGLSGVCLMALSLFHAMVLEKTVKQEHDVKAKNTWEDAFRAFFIQSGILGLLVFLLFFRFGEALLLRMSKPFLRDPQVAGGLGLSNVTIGWIEGAGVTALTLGGLWGGVALKRWGLRSCRMWMCLSMTLPNTVYVWVSVVPMSDLCVGLLLCLEQLGYGIGLMLFTMIVLRIAKRSSYESAFFAMGTGLMTLGLLLPGMISGGLWSILGYPWFFGVSLFLSLCGGGTLWLLPKWVFEEDKPKISATCPG